MGPREDKDKTIALMAANHPRGLCAAVMFIDDFKHGEIVITHAEIMQSINKLIQITAYSVKEAAEVFNQAASGATLQLNKPSDALCDLRINHVETDDERSLRLLHTQMYIPIKTGITQRMANKPIKLNIRNTIK